MTNKNECDACETARIGCGCDGAFDDGCFLCSPELHERPPCTCSKPAPKLIALAGPAGCGKSTIAKELTHRGFVRVRFAGPLKAMLRALGLTEAQVDGDEKETPLDLLCGKTPRYAMQTIGTEWGRRLIGDDIWANATMIEVDLLLAQGHDVVIDDLRFDNEARALTGRRATIVDVQRPGFEHNDTHASETGIAPTWITQRITNDSTPEAAAIEILKANT